MDRQSGALLRSMNMSEFFTLNIFMFSCGNVHFLDLQRVLCVTLSFSQTFDGMDSPLLRNDLVSFSPSAATFSHVLHVRSCKKMIRNLVTHMHDQEFGILQEKSS